MESFWLDEVLIKLLARVSREMVGSRAKLPLPLQHLLLDM